MYGFVSLVCNDLRELVYKNIWSYL